MSQIEKRPWQVPLGPQRDEKASAFSVLFLLALLALMVGAGFWSFRSQLDIVSVAIGEVKPSSRVRDVQHLEGGIVEEILISEGDAVVEGQPLLTLASTRNAADVAELQTRLLYLEVERARLLAEVSDTPIEDAFSATLQLKAPDLVKQAASLLESTRQEAATEAERLTNTAQQRQQEIRAIQTRRSNALKSLTLFKEQVEISAELLRKNITNRYSHLQLQRELQDLEGAIAQDAEALKGAKAALDVAENSLEEARLRRINAVSAELAQVERDFTEMGQRMLKFQDSLTRTVLRAPVSGLVKEISVSTIGGVVQPGETVAAIVPGDDRLIVEATLPPQEIGYVKPGQRAVIKLNSPDLVRFGNIDGTVAEISPDRLMTEDGVPYFRVRIDADASFFSNGEDRYDLFPGTQVVANIRTGKRTVLDYITAPILSQGGQALMER